MPRLLLITALLCLTMTLPSANAAPQQPSPTPVPAPPAWLADVDALYDAQLRVAGLDDHRFGPEQWWDIATPLLQEDRGFEIMEIGRSVEDRPLRHVTWGKGTTRVLLWSQMHGDESTGSMALADLFRFLGEHPRHPVAARIANHTRLHVFPIVNPDGAARFQRRNAQGIDINRDAAALATPEGRTLKALHDQVRPVFGFNLHDQRVGYRAGDSERGTAIAVLSPPFNAEREVNAVRSRAIEVSAAIRIALEPYIAGHIARWDDAFNPIAFGDLTTQWGTSTVLIEAGGIDGDRGKQRLRKLYFLALVAALDSIATGEHAGLPHALYTELPENGDVWPDLAIRGGTVVTPGLPPTRADVMVTFRDPLSETGGSISGFGDLRTSPSRFSIDATGLYVVAADLEGCAAPSRVTSGAPACFHLSRDPEGRDIVWTLARDVDPDRPRPE